MLEWLRELLEIYTWKELWILVGVATIMIGAMAGFSLMLRIGNEIIRAVAIWSLISTLTAGAAMTDYLRRHEK